MRLRLFATLPATLIVAFTLIPALHLQARDFPTVKPAEEGFSAERLERIDTYMERAVKDGVMVGGQGSSHATVLSSTTKPGVSGIAKSVCQWKRTPFTACIR